MTDYHAKFEHTAVYHIYNRGNNRENLFTQDRNYSYFLSKWCKYVLPSAKVFAWVLMPNHFHFLIQVRSREVFPACLPDDQQKQWARCGEDIDTFLTERFQRFFAGYTLAINKQDERSGSLFQKRFRRVKVNWDTQFFRLLHYIHNNPVHHGFVKDPMDWPHQSLHEYDHRENAKLVDLTWVSQWLDREEVLRFQPPGVDSFGFDPEY